MGDEPILDVSRETFLRLGILETALRKWNARINLVGSSELNQLWERHIADSLRLGRLLPSSGPIVDLGSGAGFPGLVLSLATGRKVTLVESDRRKAAFLREVARETRASVTVVAARIEQSGIRDASIVTARALAPMPRLLGLAAPVLADDGVCFFIKGARVESELTEARRQWQMDTRYHACGTGGCVIEVRHLHRTDTVRG